MKKYTLYIAIAAALMSAYAFGADGAIEARTILAEGGMSKDLHETWNIPADGRVEVSNISGSVTVTTWDKPVADLSGSLGHDSKLEISGDATHLNLKVGSVNEGRTHNGPSTDSDLILRLPRAVALDLNVISADAKVNGVAGKTLEVASVSGTVSINSGAPDVDINSVSGDVAFDAAANTTMTRAHLQTVSGNINAKGLSGRVKLETVSGDILLDASQVQDLEAGTVSGDAKLTLAPTGRASVKLETMSGDLRVHLPSAVSAHIEATTFSGGIDSDFGKVQEKGMGPGSTLDAQAGSGDARITANSFSGSIEFRKQ
jgi:Putative adhesin